MARRPPPEPAKPPRLGPVEEALVQALGRRGEGLVRTGGDPVFVPGALPGETIRFRRDLDGPRTDRGHLEAVVAPHPARRATPCEHDRPDGCGLCTLLGVEPAIAREFVLAELSRALAPLGALGPLLGPAPEQAVRHAVHGAFDTRGRWLWPRRAHPGAKITRLAIERCEVLHPDLEALRCSLIGKAPGVREAVLRMSPSTRERMVVLEIDEQPEPLDPVAFDAVIALRDGDRILPLRGHPWMREQILGKDLRIGALSRFRFDSSVAAAVAGYVRDLARSVGALRALDLEAGPGLMAVAGLQDVPRVIACEPRRAEFQDCEESLRGARRLGEVSIRRLDAESALKDLIAVREPIDLAVCDAAGIGGGLSERAFQALAQLSPKDIVWTARDARRLEADFGPLHAAGYRLHALHPLAAPLGSHEAEILAHVRRTPASSTL